MNFKKINSKKILFIVAMAIVFLNAKNVLAASTFNYTLLESFPGFFTEGTVMTDLPKMILAIYKFGIWTIGIAGLFMITVGGIMYAGSAGNTSTATNAKGIITDALIGIAAAMLAYLFLYVINPDLTNLNINFTAVNVDESDDLETVSQMMSFGVGSPMTATGDCKGMQTSVKAQCDLASAELSSIFDCMGRAGVKRVVYSITASNVGNNYAKAQACCGNPACIHSTNSCHYGCPAGLSGSWKGEIGRSHGFDIDISGMSNDEQCKLASIAKSCGAGTIWGPGNICDGKVRFQAGHTTHFHISTKSCNH